MEKVSVNAPSKGGIRQEVRCGQPHSAVKVERRDGAAGQGVCTYYVSAST